MTKEFNIEFIIYLSWLAEINNLNVILSKLKDFSHFINFCIIKSSWKQKGALLGLSRLILIALIQITMTKLIISDVSISFSNKIEYITINLILGKQYARSHINVNVLYSILKISEIPQGYLSSVGLSKACRCKVVSICSNKCCLWFFRSQMSRCFISDFI